MANATFRCSLCSTWLWHRANAPAPGKDGRAQSSGSPHPTTPHPGAGTEAALRLPPRLSGDSSEEPKPSSCFDPINRNLFRARQHFPAGGFVASLGCAISTGRSQPPAEACSLPSPAPALLHDQHPTDGNCYHQRFAANFRG